MGKSAIAWPTLHSRHKNFSMTKNEDFRSGDCILHESEHYYVLSTLYPQACGTRIHAFYSTEIQIPLFYW